MYMHATCKGKMKTQNKEGNNNAYRIVV